MRALFWWRRNDRLIKRINGVIETSERVRTSYRPKTPRVVIDTSYLQQPAVFDPEPCEDRPADVVSSFDAAGADAAWADPVAAAEYSAAPIEPGSPMTEETESEAFALLREAARQLEVSDQREAEARRGEAEALEAVELLRGHTAELEARVDEEQAARHEADARCERALRAAAEAERKLSAVQQAAPQVHLFESQIAEARRHEAAAKREVEVERQRAVQLQARACAEAAARLEADAMREDAARAAEAALQELAGLREALLKLEEHCRSEAEARTKAEAKNRLEQATRREIASQRDKALRAASEAQREIAALRQAANASEQTRHRELEARLAQSVQAAAEANQALAALQEAAARREADLRVELAAMAQQLAAREPARIEPAAVASPSSELSPNVGDGRADQAAAAAG